MMLTRSFNRSRTVVRDKSLIRRRVCSGGASYGERVVTSGSSRSPTFLNWPMDERARLNLALSICINLPNLVILVIRTKALKALQVVLENCNSSRGGVVEVEAPVLWLG